jgi:alpha-1,6-mannosyltransferase
VKVADKVMSVMWCSFVAMALLMVSVLASSVFALASFHNYPGGVALHNLTAKHLPQYIAHTAAKGNAAPRSISVHMDVPACMTGASRYVTTQQRDLVVSFL